MADLKDNFDGPWDDSAEVYARLAPLISFYRETVRRVIDAASLLPGMQVVDLAAGSTGMLEREIMELIPDIQQLYCVDSSRKMLEWVRKNIHWTKVEFVLCKAEELHERLPVKVDKILCNSSIWHFDLRRAMDAIHRSLQPKGSFVFTIGEWDLEGSGVESNIRYAAIDKELSRRSLPPKPSRGSREKLNIEALRKLLIEESFKSVCFEEFLVDVSAQDFCNFYRIPAIARRSLPQLPAEIAKDVLLKAMSTLSEIKLPPMRWVLGKAS